MDKIFSDLTDIVNRSKKIDSKEKETKAAGTKRGLDYVPKQFDIEEKKSKSNLKKSMSTDSAIGKLLNSKKTTAKKSTTKKTTTKTKKTPTAAKTKKEPQKAKPVEEKPKNKEVKKLENIFENLKKQEVKEKKPKIHTELNLNDPKQAQLYEALQDSLLKGGTDISEYVDLNAESNSNKDTLSQLKAKREAQKLNAEITKEQQEYEQLFTGSLGSFDGSEEEEEEKTTKSTRPRVKTERSEKNPDDVVYEFETGNEDLDRKIAEYYKRKQEKINRYNASLDSFEQAKPKEEKVDYEAIFNGEMYSRSEIMGEPTDNGNEPAEQTLDSTETENISNETNTENETTTTTENETEVRSTEPVTEVSENSEKTSQAVEGVADENSSSTTESNAEETHETTTESSEDEKQKHIQNILDDILYSDKEREKEKEPMQALPESVEANAEKVVDELIDKLSDMVEKEDAIVTEPAQSTEQGKVETECESDTQTTQESVDIEAKEQALNTTDENDAEEEKENEDEVESTTTDTEATELDLRNSESSESETDTIEEIVEPEKLQSDDDILMEQTDEDLEENQSEEENNSEFDEQFNSVVENEKFYRETSDRVVSKQDEEIDGNTYVMSSLPEDKYSLFDINNLDENESEEKNEEEKTITKDEFYKEMARLQENLVNELKGRETTKSKDFFEDTTSEPEEVAPENVAEVETEVEDEKEENVETEPEEIEKAEVSVEPEKESTESVEVEKTDSANEVKADSTEDETKTVEEKVETPTVDPSEYENYNLLNKDVALNEEDLNYTTKVEEKPTTDSVFYASPEDNERKSSVVDDDYLSIYDNTTNAKEMGDITLFKDIGNATPSSEILKQLQALEQELNYDDDEDVQAVYTLMGIKKVDAKPVEPEVKVLYAASECQPFIASGGLGDVAGSLPKELAKLGGIDIRVILPLYGNIKNEYRDKFEYLGNFTVHLSWRQEYCGLFRYFKDGVTYYFVDNERYFKRDSLYGYYDDGERFAYFSKAIVEALQYLNFFPDIIHCNDWQTSLVSTYIKTGNWSDYRYYKIKHIYTIHNVEYQGVYGMENLKDLFGIDPRFKNDLEYNGDINLTKAAIQYSDKFTTVSNSYCDNLKQPYCSRGLHHIIIRNEYKLCGILNGIDYDFYNPATDRNIFKNYDSMCVEEKAMNKKLWQDELGLPVDENIPMLAIVSRLVSHKGMDLLNKVLENILQQDVQLVVVGTGEQKYVDYFKYLQGKYNNKVRCFVDKYSNEVARKAYAASDIFLMPSKIEPCGLSHMVASRYGSVPIVRETGGLRDTVKDFGCEGGGNGYTFTNYNPNDLSYCINHAIRDFGNKAEWREKVKTVMNVDFTWEKRAKEYLELYKAVFKSY